MWVRRCDYPREPGEYKVKIETDSGAEITTLHYTGEGWCDKNFRAVNGKITWWEQLFEERVGRDEERTILDYLWSCLRTVIVIASYSKGKDEKWETVGEFAACTMECLEKLIETRELEEMDGANPSAAAAASPQQAGATGKDGAE